MTRAISARWLVHFCLVLVAATANASIISWGTVQTDTGNPTDVVTDGVFFDSAAILNGGPSDVILNGVTFNHYSAFSGSGPYSLSFANSSGITFSNMAVGQSGPYATPAAWNDTYETLLATGTYAQNSNGGAWINLTGLTLDHDYLVQIWAPYWSDSYPTRFIAGNTSPYLANGVSLSTTGQYILGTFTADATTLQIQATGSSGFPLLAAIQVRDVTIIPEPSTALLSVAGGLIIWRVRRRRGPRPAAPPAEPGSL